MTDRHSRLHEPLLEQLAELNLTHIAATYRETLDEAARKNSSMLDVLASLVASEVTARRQRALQRRILQARLPKLKTLAEYQFDFPKRVPKQKIVRLFDCEFVEQHQCAIFIGPTGCGKTHLMTALGYAACERGISVRFTRAIDMINRLTTAQMNGTLELALKAYLKPSLLLLDELGYLPIDKRGADLLFQVVAARYESGSIVITTNRPFRDWGRIFDVDNTLATAMIDRLMHHGEAMVIQGSSFRTKGETPDESSLSRHHFAQTALAASVRAVRHLPETLLALCSRISLSDAASEASAASGGVSPLALALTSVLWLQPQRRAAPSPSGETELSWYPRQPLPWTATPTCLSRTVPTPPLCCAAQRMTTIGQNQNSARKKRLRRARESYANASAPPPW